MSTYPGTIALGGMLAPTDTSDTYPITDGNFALGGPWAGADHTFRDAIPAARRRVGGCCFTESDGKTWQLQGGVANGDWVDTTASGTKEVTHSFSWGDAPSTVYTVVGIQTAWEVLLEVETVFDGVGASIVVGDTSVSNRLMTASQNDPYETALFATDPAYDYVDGDEIVLTITPGTGASQGSGKLKLKF